MTKKKAAEKKPKTTRTLSARSSKKIATKAKRKPAFEAPFKNHKPAKPIRVKFHTRQKRKPAFEAALDVEAQAAEVQAAEAQAAEADRIEKTPAPESPEFAEPARLPDKTYPGLIPVLKIPFAIWSNIKKMPGIRLSDEEADEWGLPVTQLIEYYFPGKIPEIAWVWLMFLSATGKVIDSRVDMIHKKSQGEERSPEPGPEAKPAPGEITKPKHEGAEVAEEMPQG